MKMNCTGGSKRTKPDKANFKLLPAQEAREILARYEKFAFYDENVIIWARIYLAFLLT
jgi:hypothetical protein